MGLSQSFQNISTFDSYHTIVQRHPKSFFFGPQLQIYKNKFNPKQQFAKHLLKFDEAKSMNHFVSEIRSLIDTKANNLPFNILYPINVFPKEQNSIINNITTSCSQKTNQVIVIHKWLGKNLLDFVRDKNQPLNEKLIWFILNDISKSLEILQEKNHACHYLMPENIWHNQNDNWFLYDGHYVIGHDFLNEFNQKKIKQNVFMSEDFGKKIQLNSIITSYQVLQEDIFCLGYCLIFMMTVIHPKQLPQKSQERDICVNDLLQGVTVLQCEGNSQTDRLKKIQNQLIPAKYSIELINFVRNLIKPDPKRRYSLRQIRNYLKTKEHQIFMNEQQQWSRTTVQKADEVQSDCKNTAYKFRKTNLVKSPQRQLNNKAFIQHSELKDRTMTSMRTLKKQPLPQKFFAMKNQELSTKLPISLIENEGTNNSRLQQGQTTPIRRIQAVRTHRFEQYKMASNATFRADHFIPNGQPHLGNPNPNILRPNLPSTFISPQKHSSSSINPYSTMESFPQNIPSQHFTHTQINTANHVTFNSPPNHAYQSPVKVKVNYFSPQKTYF